MVSGSIFGFHPPVDPSIVDAAPMFHAEWTNVSSHHHKGHLTWEANFCPGDRSMVTEICFIHCGI